MELQTIIKHRRNIKPQFFTSDVIPDQDIKDILESANWAPTHGFTEPWRFVVFAGSSRQDFATFQSDTYKSKATPESFQIIKYDKLLSTPLLASHIIAVVAKNTEHSKIPFLEEIVAVSCSVQNILLSAAEKNIAVHWTTGGVTYSEHEKLVKEITPPSKNPDWYKIYMGNQHYNDAIALALAEESSAR